MKHLCTVLLLFRHVFSEEKVNDLYCVIYTIRDDVITVNYSWDGGAYYPYDWPYYGSDEEMILTTGIAKTFSDYSSFEGGFSFVLVPIMDENEEAVGLIEVGVNLRAYEEEMDDIVDNVMMGITISGIVAVFLVVQLLKTAEYRYDEDE